MFAKPTSLLLAAAVVSKLASPDRALCHVNKRKIINKATAPARLATVPGSRLLLLLGGVDLSLNFGLGIMALITRLTSHSALDQVQGSRQQWTLFTFRPSRFGVKAGLRAYGLDGPG